MADKPQQQQTLSVRISEALRQRLERAKELVTSKTGETVSTSDIAKQLLESAREDRLEVVDLLAEPTKSLLEIRRKGEAERILSKAEWTVLAHFVQQGLEAFLNDGDSPSPGFRESLVAVLDAFLAAYELRKGASTRDEYYLGNLPSDCQPAKSRTSQTTEKIAPEFVRQTVTETRRRMGEATKYLPLLAGRNLYVLLEDEKLSSADALNRALRPYWPNLWKLAARGHYCLKHEPVREAPEISEELLKPQIPPITESGFTLSFARGYGNDFSLLLSFPGARAPQYPFERYPVIAEFRTMLTLLTPDGSMSSWKGEHFLGYRMVWEKEETLFSFRARDNGITFTFSAKEWVAVQELFRRAWEIPDLRAAWEGLILEYGEL
ncbi:MAG: hypothetical protein ACRD5K_05510 [Candidatus Acidiferrales bacterium]